MESAGCESAARCFIFPGEGKEGGRGSHDRETELKPALIHVSAQKVESHASACNENPFFTQGSCNTATQLRALIGRQRSYTFVMYNTGVANTVPVGVWSPAASI